MSTNPPAWLKAVKAAEARIERGRHIMTTGGDDRARAIAAAVEQLGGHTWAIMSVAGILGAKPNQVYVARRRAHSAPAPQHLPDDLLGQLYALELAEMPPLPARLWQALAQILAGTLVDITWIEQPGRFIACEVEDSIGEEVDEADAKRLADAARSWTRIQALAVLDAIGRRDFDALRTEGNE